METMHAAGRRTLPPVPRTGGRRRAARPDVARADVVRPDVARAAASSTEIPTQRFVVDFAADQAGTVDRAGAEPPLDASQQFVERLRAAASDFAEAAGAASAVVQEAVPPARHRRARCRVVLRYADDTESDVTFLGPAGSPGRPSRHGFERQIRRWFDGGQRREAAWLVPDEDAADGLAIDVSAWLTAA